METLRNISVVWVTIHAFVLNFLMIVPRFSWKKYLILTLIIIGGLTVGNIVAIFIFGIVTISKISLLTMSLPSFIYFFLVSKYHDGRIVFIFCIGDIITMMMICYTGIIGAFLHDNVPFIFISRIVLVLLVEFLMVKYMRSFYRYVMDEIKGIWWIISAVSVAFYITVTISYSYPSPIMQRLKDVPQFVILTILVILTYIMIAQMLRDQLRINRFEQTEKLLSVQIQSFENTIQAMERNEKSLKILRHDLRHYENNMLKLLQDGNIEDAINMLGGIKDITDNAAPIRYCSDNALNSVLLYYTELAAKIDCKVTVKIDLNDLPVNTAELCIVFANALDNAVKACEKIPDCDKREIKITCMDRPHFSLGIYNTYSGTVSINEAGLPISDSPDHGYGTQSIQAFAFKHNAVLDYDVTDKWFKLRLVINR